MTRFVPLLMSLALLPIAAVAQEADDSAARRGFNAHHFHIAALDGDLRDALVIQRPGRMTQWDWFVGGLVEYANAPLVRYETNAAGETFSNPILDHVLALHVSGGVTLHQRFRLDLSFPLYFASFDGNQNYQGVDMGDIRLSGLVSILAPDDEEQGFGLGVVGRMDIPSGASRQYLGDRTIAGGGSVVATYGYRGFTASAEAGVLFRPSIDFGNITRPDIANFGLGVGYLVHETTSVNLEAKMDATFKKVEPAGTESPIELLALVRHRRPNGGHLMVGGSAGLVRAAGTARFRVFVGGGFGKIQVPPPKDMDLDGLVDEIDTCPEDPETVNGWEDEDGCPDELATLDLQVYHDGEPLRGSEIELTVGDSEESEKMISRDAPRRKEGLEPLQSVEVRATFGSCLAGDASTDLEEGQNTLDIRLRPRRSARVVYEITDLEGMPVPDAVATWKVSEDGCAEPGGYNLGQNGTFEHPMGVGTHTLFVDAPGFRIHREEVTLDTGDTHLVKVQMQSTRVKVDRTAITILEKVYFETGKATIKPESFSLLDEVATVILATELGRVRIEGHTDNVGNDNYNMDLSQRRADAVREYLISKGLSGDDLIAVGYGESQPVVSNASAAGRAQNRRVVFTLLDQVEQQIEINE